MKTLSGRPLVRFHGDWDIARHLYGARVFERISAHTHQTACTQTRLHRRVYGFRELRPDNKPLTAISIIESLPFFFIIIKRL